MQKKFGYFFIILILYVVLLGRLLPMFWSMNQGVAVVLGVVAFLLIPLAAVFFIRPSKKIRQLMTLGEIAQATILKITDTNLTMGTSYCFRVLLRIEVGGAQPFDTEIEHCFPRSALPRVGDKMAVRFDPADHTAVAIV